MNHKMKFTLLVILIGILLAIIVTTTIAKASEEQIVYGQLTDIQSYYYYDTIKISAYYPGEDGYHKNHRGAKLTELVDGIIATQTKGGHSSLLGKTVMLVMPDGKTLIRKVDDRGCYRGRLDLLVKDHRAMTDWGLKDCEVWVLEESGDE